MPRRDLVDPQFDGHLERPLLELSVEERLDWIWAAMQVLRLGATAREARSPPLTAPSTPAGSAGSPR